MAFTGSLYGQAMLHLARKRCDLLNDALTLTAHTSSYTPNKDTHDYVDDLTNEVGTGGGYTSGGVVLQNVTVTYDTATDTVIVDADDVVWASATFTFRHLVISDRTPSGGSAQPLLGYQLGDANVTGQGGNLTAVMPSNGIMRYTAS